MKTKRIAVKANECAEVCVRTGENSFVLAIHGPGSLDVVISVVTSKSNGPILEAEERRRTKRTGKSCTSVTRLRTDLRT